jgi:phosphoribosyl 1,2-cyclic phosphodiesterase
MSVAFDHQTDKMTLCFWGVRGSYPQCQPSFMKVGGNTVCVSLAFRDQYLIFDAGTGLIDAGRDILQRGLKKATLLISHPHADHIQGLAFFKPLHQPDFELTIIGGGFVGGIESVLEIALSPPYFPVSWHQIPCRRTCIDVPLGAEFSIKHLRASTIGLDHPGGSCGYRVEVGDKSVCYITDTAHTPGLVNRDLVEFINHTNLLIYDAAFTEEEFALKSTWGHSTWNQAVALAKAAAIQELALFHHYPEHDDDFMDKIEAEARTQFPRTFVSRQGMVVEI